MDERGELALSEAELAFRFHVLRDEICRQDILLHADGLACDDALTFFAAPDGPVLDTASDLVDHLREANGKRFHGRGRLATEPRAQPI